MMQKLLSVEEKNIFFVKRTKKYNKFDIYKDGKKAKTIFIDPVYRHAIPEGYYIISDTGVVFNPLGELVGYWDEEDRKEV